MDMYMLICSEEMPMANTTFLGVFETRMQAEAAKQSNIRNMEDAEDEMYSIIKTEINKKQNKVLGVPYMV
ncbi:hypothetical protein [Staphylococcus xylosus]|uniref:hypothetical protein n=1 Tax=Staphylococcus xylosus TaxID=1288 RepID=UPI0011C96DA1|nr:hypothetical protein [Staphylococcus xylosus]